MSPIPIWKKIRRIDRVRDLNGHWRSPVIIPILPASSPETGKQERIRMGGIGIWQILIVAIVILVLFGRGRISEMMGDFGRGISSFKKGMNETEETVSSAKAQIEAPAKDAASTEAKTGEKSDNPG
ncbi:twin-arginine translocase TatA/TatE family subunit [Erythrobacter aurantius]|uniref:twin-arginine translocase TatA/TatE family subunit n=2 Tax=Erythrobacter TaxID=1041 RepID=UPI0038B2DF74